MNAKCQIPGLADVIIPCRIILDLCHIVSRTLCINMMLSVFVLGSEIRLCLHGTVILLVTGVIYRSSYESAPKVT